MCWHSELPGPCLLLSLPPSLPPSLPRSLSLVSLPSTLSYLWKEGTWWSRLPGQQSAGEAQYSLTLQGYIKVSVNQRWPRFRGVLWFQIHHASPVMHRWHNYMISYFWLGSLRRGQPLSRLLTEIVPNDLRVSRQAIITCPSCYITYSANLWKVIISCIP